MLFRSKVSSSTFLRGDNTFDTPPLGGITSVSQFRLTTSFTGSALPIASNWEEVDTNGYAGIGSSMTESSGIFTFPSTGIWLITFRHVSQNSTSSEYLNQEIEITTNNSSYSGAAVAYANNGGTNTFASSISQHIFDVTDTSTHKVRFRVFPSIGSSSTTNGSTSDTRTSVIFLRLGDT